MTTGPTVIDLPGSLRDQWNPGDTATFTYSLDPNDPSSEIAKQLGHRSGQTVTVLGEDEHDTDRDEFPTLAERADAGALIVYRIRFADGHENTAFEDELSG